MPMSQTERTRAYRDRNGACWNCGVRPAVAVQRPHIGQYVRLCAGCRRAMDRARAKAAAGGAP